MTSHLRSALAATLVLLAALASPAQDGGYWYPESKSAHSTTGPVEIKNSHVTIDLSVVPIVAVRPLTQAEAVAVFDADTTIPGGGLLYRLKIPGTYKFVNKNTLCGHDDTEWMATWATRRTLAVAFFSGTKPPELTFEALSSSSDVCGTFTYTR